MMNKLYMGIDAGTVFIKGIVIDEYDNIITSCCVKTFGNPLENVKKIILKMKEDINFSEYRVVSVGVTGSARKLIGLLLDAQVIKNEITTLSVGVIRMYPDVRTIKNTNELLFSGTYYYSYCTGIKTGSS